MRTNLHKNWCDSKIFTFIDFFLFSSMRFFATFRSAVEGAALSAAQSTEHNFRNVLTTTGPWASTADATTKSMEFIFIEYQLKWLLFFLILLFRPFFFTSAVGFLYKFYVGVHLIVHFAHTIHAVEETMCERTKIMTLFNGYSQWHREPIKLRKNESRDRYSRIT